MPISELPAIGAAICIAPSGMLIRELSGQRRRCWLGAALAVIGTGLSLRNRVAAGAWTKQDGSGRQT